MPLMSNPGSKSAGARFDQLVELIARLRAPGGCPWDREQTHESLKPMTLEEAYEVVEAIDGGDDAELAGELGDLLLQAVFHSQIAAEERRFDVKDVIDRVVAKMHRRHPHVFGGETASSSRDVLRTWEAIKATELEEKAPGDAPPRSMLDSVSRGLPAVMESFQMTTKVSRVGFDWPDAAAVLEKLQEEIAEYQAAATREGGSVEQVAEEIGDLLFAAVNLARQHGVDPESALKAANRKFRRRFGHVERRLRERGLTPAESNLEEMDALWEEAKELEQAG
jgi:tetrapyrrole methylase family protein / MazG family protein